MGEGGGGAISTVLELRSASRTINTHNTSQSGYDDSSSARSSLVLFFGYGFRSETCRRQPTADTHIKQLSTKRKQQIAHSGKSFFILVFGFFSLPFARIVRCIGCRDGVAWNELTILALRDCAMSAAGAIWPKQYIR